MVFYADIRCPPFKVHVNANYVRTVIEDCLDCEMNEDVLEPVCLRVETEVRYRLMCGKCLDEMGQIILDCYESETAMHD